RQQEPPQQNRPSAWGNLSDFNEQPRQQDPPPQRRQNAWGSLSDLNEPPRQQEPPPQKSQGQLSFEELHRNAQMRLMGETLPNESQSDGMTMAERKKILSEPIDIDKILAQTSQKPVETPIDQKVNSKESLHELLMNTPQRSQAQASTQLQIVPPEPRQQLQEPVQQVQVQQQQVQAQIQPEAIKKQPEPLPQKAEIPTFVEKERDLEGFTVPPKKRMASFGVINDSEEDLSQYTTPPKKRSATFGVFNDSEEDLSQYTTPPKKKSAFGRFGNSKKEKNLLERNEPSIFEKELPKKLTEDDLFAREMQSLNASFASKNSFNEEVSTPEMVIEENGNEVLYNNEVSFPSRALVENPLIESAIIESPPIEKNVELWQPKMTIETTAPTMQEPETIESITAYVDRVCSLVRWRKARRHIRKELEDHIYEQREHYIDEGDDVENATYEAILQMGDAKLVGDEYNEAHRPKEQTLLLGLFAFLFAIGFYVQLALFQTQYEPSYKTLFQHGIALLAFAVCYFFDFSLFGKYARWLTPILFLIPVGLLVANAFEVADTVELFHAYATFVFPLAYGLLVYAMQKTGHHGLIISLAGYLFLCVLLIFHEMYANVLLFSCTAFILSHYAVARRWYGVNRKRTFAIMTALTTGIIAVAVVFIDRHPDLLDRIRIIFYPQIDPTGSGYLYVTLQQVIASCNFFTRGGNLDTVTVRMLIDEFPLTYLATKNGLWIFFAVAIPIVTFFALALYELRKQKTMIGALLLIAIAVPIFFQSSMFLLSATGKLIVESYFPMVSYGLFGHIFAFGILGIAASVLRIGYLCQDTKREFAL
ncbi:MAG: permease prefix domain 1-containing protein, partial [Bacillota bacterium]